MIHLFRPISTLFSRKVIELVNELGHPLDLFDIYSSGRFNNHEIDLLNDKDILHRLLDGRPILTSEQSPQPGTDGSNLELCNIIKLRPERDDEVYR